MIDCARFFICKREPYKTSKDGVIIVREYKRELKVTGFE